MCLHPKFYIYIIFYVIVLNTPIQPSKIMRLFDQVNEHQFHVKIRKKIHSSENWKKNKVTIMAMLPDMIRGVDYN